MITDEKLTTNELIKAKFYNPTLENIKDLSSKLNEGKLVAFATETVYGLGANCFNKDSVLNIFKYKGRPLSDPLILHVHSIEQILPLVDINKEMIELLSILSNNFWPGPMTIILKANEKISNYITAGTGYASFRIPNHKDALNLLKHVSFPIAAPSANKFCHVSPVTAEHVFSDFFEFDISILNSGKCEYSIESTVIKPDIENKKILIYRKGALTKNDILKVLPDYQIDYYIKLIDHENEFKDELISNQIAPGQFIKHYSPNLPSYIINLQIEDEETNNILVNIEKSILLDYNSFYTKRLKIKPIMILDLSINNNSFEAVTNIYEYLRNSENLKGECILLPDFNLILNKDDIYLPVLVDRMEKASSGKRINLNLSNFNK